MSRRRPSARRQQLLRELDREARRTGSVSTLHGRAIADRAGIHGTDFECLDVLDWTGPVTAGELARYLGITSGAVTGVVDRLEKLGYVRRGGDPADRRRVMVELTEQPQDVRREELEAFFRPLQQELEEINDRYDDTQLAVIAEWLGSANNAIERSTERLRNR